MKAKQDNKPEKLVGGRKYMYYALIAAISVLYATVSFEYFKSDMMSKYIDWIAVELLSVPLYALYVYSVIKSFNEKKKADQKKIQIETYN